jgi:hypothetical protein
MKMTVERQASESKESTRADASSDRAEDGLGAACDTHLSVQCECDDTGAPHCSSVRCTLPLVCPSARSLALAVRRVHCRVSISSHCEPRAPPRKELVDSVASEAAVAEETTTPPPCAPSSLGRGPTRPLPVIDCHPARIEDSHGVELACSKRKPAEGRRSAGAGTYDCECKARRVEDTMASEEHPRCISNILRGGSRVASPALKTDSSLCYRIKRAPQRVETTPALLGAHSLSHVSCMPDLVLR